MSVDSVVGPRCLAFWEMVVRTVHPITEPVPDYLRTDIDSPPSWLTSTRIIAQAFYELYTDTSICAKRFLFFISKDLMPAVIGTPEEEVFAYPLKLRRQPGYTRMAAAFALLYARKLRGHYPVFYNGPLMDPNGEAQKYIREKVPQNSPIWYCLRAFFMGGSGLAEIFNMGYKTPTSPVDEAQFLLHCHLGIKSKPPFPANVKCALFNGHVQEELAREIYCAITKQRVIERGTVISSANAAYSHSPDGLIVDSAGEPVGLLEIKTRQLTSKAYTECPDYYLVQCIQGIVVHKVQYCDFVSMAYNPAYRDGSFVTITIERLQVKPETVVWMQTILDMFATALRDRQETLPDDFYCMQAENQFRTGVIRSYPKVHIGNIIVNEPVALALDLNKVLSPERRLYWSKQPRLDPRNPPEYFNNATFVP